MGFKDFYKLSLPFCVIVEGRDYKSLRARMSCGHSVTPMSLTSWCHHLLDQVPHVYY